jgi:hypothetical protein
VSTTLVSSSIGVTSSTALAALRVTWRLGRRLLLGFGGLGGRLGGRRSLCHGTERQSQECGDQGNFLHVWVSLRLGSKVSFQEAARKPRFRLGGQRAPCCVGARQDLPEVAVARAVVQCAINL